MITIFLVLLADVLIRSRLVMNTTRAIQTPALQTQYIPKDQSQQTEESYVMDDGGRGCKVFTAKVSAFAFMCK